MALVVRGKHQQEAAGVRACGRDRVRHGQASIMRHRRRRRTNNNNEKEEEEKVENGSTHRSTAGGGAPLDDSSLQHRNDVTVDMSTPSSTFLSVRNKRASSPQPPPSLLATRGEEPCKNCGGSSQDANGEIGEKASLGARRGRGPKLQRWKLRVHHLLLLLWWLLLLSPVALVVWGVTVWFTNLATHHECDMTWMQPNYVALPLNHSRYTLYRYRDSRESRPRTGTSASSSSSSMSSMSNVALLFVPGHGGSYQQARSIGAHAIGLSRRNNPPSHPIVNNVDNNNNNNNNNNDGSANPRVLVYALDFQEEPTNLHGRLVEEQAQFVGQAVRHLQQSGFRVLVFAHSLGGYAALWAVARRYCHIPLVLTLGTPHRHPVLTWDAALRTIHRNYVHHQWNSRTGRYHPHHDSSNNNNNNNNNNSGSFSLPEPTTVVLSLSGGFRDELIPPHACRAPRKRVVDHNNLHDTNDDSNNNYEDDLSWTAAQIMKAPIYEGTERVQLGMDHRALAWCHNLLEPVLEMIRAFLDLEQGNPGNDPLSPIAVGDAIRKRLHLEKEDYDVLLQQQSVTLARQCGRVKALALEASALYNAEWLVNLYTCAAFWHWALGSPWHYWQWKWFGGSSRRSAAFVSDWTISALVLLAVPPLLATQAYIASLARPLSWEALWVLAGVAVALLVGVRTILAGLSCLRGTEPSAVPPHDDAPTSLPGWDFAPLLAAMTGLFVSHAFAKFKGKTADTPATFFVHWLVLCLAVASLVGSSLQAVDLASRLSSNVVGHHQAKTIPFHRRSDDADQTMTLLAAVVGVSPFLLVGEVAWTVLRGGHVHATFFECIFPEMLWVSLTSCRWRQQQQQQLRAGAESSPVTGGPWMTATRVVVAVWGGWNLFQSLWTPVEGGGGGGGAIWWDAAPPVQQSLAAVLLWDVLERFVRRRWRRRQAVAASL